ncbi:chromate transporter [Vagococcus carniphilus]|uniref:chromate transporter n=1 Tax=Vagococcus carniphilus TaxID=218144 RepID=UPI003BA91C69
MLLRLFFSFLKIGFLGFGGGYAMLSLIFEEMTSFGMTVEQYADLNALDVLIPGPIAINSATYVGQLYAGFLGAFVTTLAVCIPSVVFVNLFSTYENRIRENLYLNGILTSIKIVSVGLIFSVALILMLSTTLGVDSLSDIGSANLDVTALVVMIGTIYLSLRFQINPLLLTLLAGLVGWFLFFL